MISYAIDAAAAALIVIAFAAGMKKGLVKSVWKAVSWVACAVLVLVLINPAVKLVSETPLYEKAYEAVNGEVSERLNTAGENGKIGIPEFVLKNADIESAAKKSAEEISGNITGLILKIAVFVVLFVFIKIILAIVFHMLDTASKLPVINGTNKLLGGLLGLISILLAIYAVCAAIALFAVNEAVSDTVNSTYLVKYFYNNNILLQLIFKR